MMELPPSPARKATTEIVYSLMIIKSTHFGLYANILICIYINKTVKLNAYCTNRVIGAYISQLAVDPTSRLIIAEVSKKEPDFIEFSTFMGLITQPELPY
jgi:hypothetical protein